MAGKPLGEYEFGVPGTAGAPGKAGNAGDIRILADHLSALRAIQGWPAPDIPSNLRSIRATSILNPHGRSLYEPNANPDSICR
jgi:hypothetical protein